MNEGVFFVVEPILPQWLSIFDLKILLISLVWAFFWILIFELFLNYKKIKHEKKEVEKIKKNAHQIPKIDEENFEKKLFLLLQQFVSVKFMPKNTFAHTYLDITKYCDNEKILQIYRILENSIFQKEKFSQDTRIKILQDIQKIITKNSN